MKIIFLVMSLLGVSSVWAQVPQDNILKQTVVLKTNNIDSVLKKTERNVKLFVDNFDIKLDSGTKITRAKSVSGTLEQPILKASIKKCVFIVCQTIDLDAEFFLEQTHGSCDYNYQLIGDLRRSSQKLVDIYTHINTDICIKKTSTGAEVTLKVSLVRGSDYDSGVVQKQAQGLISLQAKSLVESFKRVMKINGVKEVL